MKHDAHPDSILIIDFGSQVTQLIARRIREAGVYCEIHPFQNAAEAFDRLKPKGVIFSGGPASVPDEGSPRAPQAVFDSGVPILGICYGQQTMAAQLGGKVEGGHAARVRPRRRRDQGGEPALRGLLGSRQALPRLDEPWRPRHRAARGLSRHRDLRERALRHRGRRGPPLLLHHVPSRGGAHAGRRQAALQLRAQDRRAEVRLDDVGLPRAR